MGFVLNILLEMSWQPALIIDSFFFYVISLINDRFVMIKLAVPTPRKGWSQPEHIQYWGVPYVLLLVVWMRLVVASVVVLTRI